MNQKRTDLATALLAAACILIDVVGGIVAQRLMLPLWLDSLGTVAAAYLMGPVSGAIVGVAGIVTSSILRGSTFAYGLTGAGIGIIVGLAARRGNFETVFGTLSCASLVTLVAVAISTPFNILLSGGMTSNPWGDAVIEFMQSMGVNRYLCYITGQFYLDFLDKVITLLALYGALRLYQRLRKRPQDEAVEAKDVTVETLCVLALALVVGLAAPNRAHAETGDLSEVAFYAATQTIYSSSNGLPCGEANDIAQTNDGVLWIGTYAGLYRYSGTEFRAMSEYESVRNVNCLYVDDIGRPTWSPPSRRSLRMTASSRTSTATYTATMQAPASRTTGCRSSSSTSTLLQQAPPRQSETRLRPSGAVTSPCSRVTT